MAAKLQSPINVVNGGTFFCASGGLYPGSLGIATGL